jgi:hypothetical protein
MLDPTAVQLVVEGAHEIPSSALNAQPDALGVDCIAQVLPFQCSTSVTLLPSGGTLLPAAVQLVDDAHETPDMRMSEPEMLGMGWIVQVLPFQFSASAT